MSRTEALLSPTARSVSRWELTASSLCLPKRHAPNNDYLIGDYHGANSRGPWQPQSWDGLRTLLQPHCTSVSQSASFPPTPTPRAPSAHLHANLQLISCFQGTRHKRKPLFQNCFVPHTSAPLWVPLAVWAHLGTPVSVTMSREKAFRAKREPRPSLFLAELGTSGFPGWQ